MTTDEFKPSMGKTLFAQHRPELEQGLRLLASAFTPGAEPDVSEFFHDFVDGFWNPYEEICGLVAEQHKDVTAKIRSLEDRLAKAMPTESQPGFERHGELLMERNISSMDLAFLVGFQCAVRFLMMGLLPAADIFKGRNEK